MRPELAAEFLRAPFGRHSRDLQDLLNHLRGAPAPGKHFLHLEDAHRHWRLARFLPDPPLGWELLDRVFDNIDDAERFVFRLRWKEKFGVDPAEGEPWPGVVSEPPPRRAATLLGYADRRAVACGETISFHVSCKGADSVRLDVVRLDGPDLPGIDYSEPVLASADLAARWHELDAGSRLELDDLSAPTGSHFDLLVKPTTFSRGTILRYGAVRLALQDGRLSLSVGEATRIDEAPAKERWLRISLSLGDCVRAEWKTVDDAPLRPGFSGSITIESRALEKPARLTLGGDGFNGLIERPRLLAANSLVLMDLDFSTDMASSDIADRMMANRAARLINRPTRAVPGAAWSGKTLEWPRAREEYAAIHFHEDDIDDARWPEAWRFDIPEDFAPGCYAAKLAAGDAQFYIPFFVRNRKKTRRVALLMPTMTYTAYANLRVRVTGAWNEMIHGRLTVLDQTDLLMLDVNGLGGSTYDLHADGSHVVYAAMDRPVTNFRPNGRIYKFCQDLLLVHWLERQAADWQPITDDELHDEGSGSLDGVDVLITSSHPEYMTSEVRTAIDAFLARGGRLMYLGGNGFFWRCARRAGRPEHVEVRRVGMEKIWQGADLSGCYSTTGEPVGTWERVGNPPNTTVGVGFVTQGFDRCEAYHRRPESSDPRAAFIFEGVGDGPIGDFGLLMGGAAGYEIDRYDISAGSPAHALVLASSRDHTPLYDLMIGRLADQLPHKESPVRADMILFETPAGGAVFSVGSIAWCGSLAYDGYANSVARVSDNVLRRFLDPAPFAFPPDGAAS